MQHKKVLHQKSFITKNNGNIGVDKIIRFENLSNDFEDTIKILGIKFRSKDLKKLNTSNDLVTEIFIMTLQEKKLKNIL